MDSLFPLNLPSPTIWYTVLYLVTLLLHVVFMSYVLAGSIMLGVAGLRGMLGRAPRASAWAPVAKVLKDWMPFALSAAITAGIAPLLFVQILYQREFYTANLLSFHRWMAILPVLIVAFYLLYLLKAHRIEARAAVQGIVAMLVMACVLFVAWSWVENHLLSMDRAAWPSQYESGSMLYANPMIFPRLGLWIAAAFPVAATLLLWQLRARASSTEPRAAAGAARSLGLLGLAWTLVAAIAAWPVLGSSAPNAGADMSRWLIVAEGGAVLAVLAWMGVAARRSASPLLLSTASAGCGVMWIGIVVAREAARWSTLGGPAIIERHARVGTLGGFIVFLVFAVLGIAAVAWIIRCVSKEVRRPS
jgi:hypothetical protein